VSPSTEESQRGFQDIDPRTCTQCGACVSICPLGVITTSGQEVQPQDGCIECGLCYQFCPGREMDFQAQSEAYFGSPPQDPLLGHYRRLLVGQATCKETREKAASGGVVTALLVHLLETKQISGAIGVVMDSERPWVSQPAILSTDEEVRKAAQSKYSLVTIDALLRTARQKSGPLALVGLPCHVHGLRRLQRIGSYRAKFPLSIGLFCGFNLPPAATDHLIAKTGFSKGQVVELEYRGGPWPGGLLVRRSDGQERFIPKHSYNYVNLAHVPRRCLACPDLTNELADLSVGDTWLEEYAGGWSTVISRSPQGERLLTEAADAGVLRLRDINRQDLLRSHGHLLAYKKEGYFVRQKWLRIPLSYKLLRPSISRRRWVQQSALLAVILALSNRPARELLQRLPISWLGWLSRRGRTAAASGGSWQAR
jgi:coenzyme F420 hydrogenase subunit beta